MSRRRGVWGLLLLFGIAQSCSNDFDQFDASGTSTRGGSSSGGSSAFSGAATRGGSTGLAGALSVGGTTTAHAGTSSTAGHAPVSAGAPGAAGAGGAVSDAGAPGSGGAAGQPACVPTAGDVANCGDCERACDTRGVASLSCESGACNSSCEVGFANCVQDATPDDGCETAVTSNTAHCGGCDNKCPAGFVCIEGQCSCDFKNDCGNGNGVECSNHLCQCSAAACRPGERCRDSAGTKVCSCNGSTGAGCAANEFCCGVGGCTDVLSNPTSCGACGRACTTGFSCSQGSCQCDNAVDCGGVEAPEVGVGGAPPDGGAPGAAGAPASNIACVQGLCVCSGNTCAEGQRCLADGHCG